jgi:DNA-binding IclR family transcriptional regulator
VTRPGGRTVTAKVMAILGAFEEGPSRLSLTEISRAAGLPKPTAHRLLAELVTSGALRRDGAGRYRVGRRIWRIGQNAGRELQDSARRHLADLFGQTGESCHLAIRDEDQVLLIDRMHGSAEPAPGSSPGDRRPLHLTATGQVLLGFEEPWILQAYLARMPPGRAARLADQLATVRQRGWAALVEDAHAGYAVAVPVLDDEHAVAAIGLVTPTGRRAELDRRVRALRLTAERIEPEARRWPNTRSIIRVFEDLPADPATS